MTRPCCIRHHGVSVALPSGSSHRLRTFQTGSNQVGCRSPYRSRATSIVSALGLLRGPSRLSSRSVLIFISYWVPVLYPIFFFFSAGWLNKGITLGLCAEGFPLGGVPCALYAPPFFFFSARVGSVSLLLLLLQVPCGILISDLFLLAACSDASTLKSWALSTSCQLPRIYEYLRYRLLTWANLLTTLVTATCLIVDTVGTVWLCRGSSSAKCFGRSWWLEVPVGLEGSPGHSVLAGYLGFYWNLMSVNILELWPICLALEWLGSVRQ